MAVEPAGIGKIASEFADSGVGKALLVPAATAIGNYLGERTEQWVERRRQKRLKNIERHVHSFEETFGKDPFETPDDKGVYEWVQGVADVNPDDPELVEIWQAALARLSDGGDKRRRLLDIVKSLTDDEARFVHRLAKSRRRSPWVEMPSLQPMKDGLRRKGILLSNADSFWIVSRVGSLLVVFYAILIVFGYIVAPDFVVQHDVYFQYGIIVIGLAAAAYMGTLRRGGYLSRDGRELIDWIRRVQLANADSAVAG